MRHRRTTWVGLALALVVLAGCGDDDAGDVAATTSTSPTPTTASTASSTTTTSSSTADADTEEAFTGVDSEAFCSVARSVPLDSALRGAGQGPELEAAFDEVLSSFEQLEQVAPEEIDDDITVVRQAWADLRQPLAAADWNLLALDPEALSGPGRAEQDAAANRLDTYLLEVCEIEPPVERG